MHIAIVGGGLSGLACAKSLVDARHQITLLESAPFLGGRASTCRDGDADWIEQGLQVHLGAYSEVRKLLSEIGREPREVLAWTNEIRFQDLVGPARATFGIDPLRAAAATLAGIFGNNEYLGPFDKLGVVPLVAPTLHRFDQLRARYDLETVAGWWARASGNPILMERLLRPLCRALHFTEPEQCSAFALLELIHHVLKAPTETHLAGYNGPRDQTIFAPLGRYLTDRGAQIRTRATVSRIGYEAHRGQQRITFVEIGDERIHADVFVAAIPCFALGKLLPPAIANEEPFRRLKQISYCSAYSVQLWFDCKVVDSTTYTLLANGVPVAYQDQATTAYPDARGSRLSVLAPATDELKESSDEFLIARVLADLRKVEPEVRPENVVKSVVLRHDDLVSPTPGTLSRRLANATPIENFFVAGDWTDQPFFGLQEGAVRSGRACAKAIQEVAARRAA
ncbi:MAG: FAD-dependent oxidoreductase [Polyangiaceae bacterium]|nr:FAD-dependent oxidoreductase [Polyangiaceae bacterium]